MARSSPLWSAAVGPYPLKGLPGNWAPDLLATVQDEPVIGEPLYPVLIMQAKHEYKALDLLYILLLLLLLLLQLLTAVEVSVGGSSPYTSTDKIIRINIHKRNNTKHSTNNTKHSKYKYTYYQNTHTLQNPHITKQVKTITVQDTPT
jgi:hypothetical protein